MANGQSGIIDQHAGNACRGKRPTLGILFDDAAQPGFREARSLAGAAVAGWLEADGDTNPAGECPIQAAPVLTGNRWPTPWRPVGSTVLVIFTASIDNALQKRADTVCRFKRLLREGDVPALRDDVKLRTQDQ